MPDIANKAIGLVVLGEEPLVVETPESLLDDDTTPTDKFYIRNNGLIPEPTRDPERWTLTIDGHVQNPLVLTPGELKANFEDSRKELFHLRNTMQRDKKSEKPHLLRLKRKEIARLLTVLHEKQSASKKSAT